MSLHTKTVAQISADLAAGEYSSEEITTALLARMEQHTELNAFVTVTAEQALEAARAADTERARLQDAKLRYLSAKLRDPATTRARLALRKSGNSPEEELRRMQEAREKLLEEIGGRLKHGHPEDPPRSPDFIPLPPELPDAAPGAAQPEGSATDWSRFLPRGACETIEEEVEAYSFDDLGLDLATERERFRGYQERYDVPSEVV